MTLVGKKNYYKKNIALLRVKCHVSKIRSTFWGSTDRQAALKLIGQGHTGGESRAAAFYYH